jgi:hypothetical protein
MMAPADLSPSIAAALEELADTASRTLARLAPEIARAHALVHARSLLFFLPTV